MSANLLIELLTEELPPKALNALAEAFANGIADGLAARGLAPTDALRTVYATPRRLAVKIAGVLERGSDRSETKKLMPSKVAFGTDGKPSAALLKRLEKEGYPPDVNIEGIVERRMEGKDEFAFHTQVLRGQSLQVALQSALEDSIAKLPIPKVMSYQLADGATTVQFVRPAHGLIALHGATVVPISVLGLQAGRITQGHRFQGARDIDVTTADAYEEALAARGKVIASFAQRRQDIFAQLQKRAAECGATLGASEDYEPLLDEVNALVESPTVYVGAFEAEYLAVPQECLVLTMRANQKYFPLFDVAGKLTNRFLIVSNMRLADPKNIIEGNQRVIRPRLADARFFFETDRKTRLEQRVPQLASIVYHNKLGSQLERTERVQILAGAVARAIGADPVLAERAAWLAKADLVTNMVGEFPELQGIMGGYYASGDGEHADVAAAISDQYHTRIEGADPANLTAMSLYVADRIETLVGIWGIGLKPTGDKDPFGLRRAALGLISAFELLGAVAKRNGGKLTLRIEDLLRQAVELFKPGLLAQTAADEIREFVYERYRNQLASVLDRSAVDAVIAVQPPLDEVVPRLNAVLEFGKLPESATLAAANKRIGNILKKAEGTATSINKTLFAEPAERALHEVIEQLRPEAARCFAAGDYAGSLKLLAETRTAVDAFFNDVMVMAEDPAQRANRIALLRELHGLMNNVADISRLAA